MGEKKLGILWAIICMVSVIIMLIVQNATGWGMAWIIPVIGVCICFIVTFVFGKDVK